MSAKVINLYQYKLQRLRDTRALDRMRYLIEVLEIMSRSGVPIADVVTINIEDEPPECRGLGDLDEYSEPDKSS